MKGYLGEIRIFTGKRTPNLWAPCNGATLKINEYPQLYEILGDTYGGDNKTTFALPDLRYKFAVGTGEGDMIDKVDLGQKFGKKTVKLTKANIPPHQHEVFLAVLNDDLVVREESKIKEWFGSSVLSPIHTILSKGKVYNKTSTPGQYLKGTSLKKSDAARDQGLDNYQPFVACSHIICIGGIPPLLEE